MKKLKYVISFILTIALIMGICCVDIVANAVNAPDFKNVNINVKMEKDVVLNNPYKKEYKLTISDKSIAKLQSGYFAEGNKRTYTFKGLKSGSTDVKVTLRKTNKVVGSFKITVGTFKTSVKQNCKKITLKYNSHGSNAYMAKSHVVINNILKNRKHKSVAKYTVDTSNANVVDTISGLIYATGKGNAVVTVYETINNTTKSIGKINVTVKNAKMNYVAKENARYYDEGIFGQGDGCEFLKIGETYNINKTVVNCLITNTYTGSKFKKSQYNITYSVPKAYRDMLTVTDDGVATAIANGTGYVRFVIKFKDGSKYKSKCEFFVDADN